MLIKFADDFIILMCYKYWSPSNCASSKGRKNVESFGCAVDDDGGCWMRHLRWDMSGERIRVAQELFLPQAFWTREKFQGMKKRFSVN